MLKHRISQTGEKMRKVESIYPLLLEKLFFCGAESLCATAADLCTDQLCFLQVRRMGRAKSTRRREASLCTRSQSTFKPQALASLSWRWSKLQNAFAPNSMAQATWRVPRVRVPKAAVC